MSQYGPIRTDNEPIAKHQDTDSVIHSLNTNPIKTSDNPSQVIRKMGRGIVVPEGTAMNTFMRDLNNAAGLEADLYNPF